VSAAVAARFLGYLDDRGIARARAVLQLDLELIGARSASDRRVGDEEAWRRERRPHNDVGTTPSTVTASALRMLMSLSRFMASPS